MKKPEDGALVEGTFNIRQIRDGEVIETREVHNVITDAGEDEIAALLGGLGATAFNALAIGEDSTAASDADTALNTEITSGGGGRAAANVNAGSNANETVFDYQWTFSASFSVQEAGVFNSTSASSGVMLCRKTFDVVNVQADDKLEIVYTITTGNAR